MGRPLREARAPDGPPQGPGADALQEVLDGTRLRFVATFAALCGSINAFIDQVAASGASEPSAALTQTAHRLSGLAGTIGFPTISARASGLEHLAAGADGAAFDAVLARDHVHAIREAFVTDLTRQPVWVPPAIPAADGATILVAEDEADQRDIVTTCLEGAGYVAIAVGSGDLVVARARAARPALILLDIAMPRLDGYSVCRLLKADSELSDIPVMFMTTGANLDDKLAGLALGADEFLSKPVDMRELLLRIQLLLERSRARSPIAAEPVASRTLTYDAFLTVAKEENARSAAALAIVRLPTAHHAKGSRVLIEEIRGRDAIGVYGATHLLILMPDMTAVAAREWLERMVDRLLAHGLEGIVAGVTASAVAGTRTVEALIGEADEALAEARYLGNRAAIWRERAPAPAAVAAVRTVVIAEDDPDVMRIVDARMRAAGYQAIVAFDGEQALAAVRAHAPDVLVLDLMMPKLNGFDVLTEIHGDSAARPRIIVLSGRGREQDVIRAFGLGADDYMTKPFNPQELMVRIARLLK